jgi:hypothetical protein
MNPLLNAIQSVVDFVRRHALVSSVVALQLGATAAVLSLIPESPLFFYAFASIATFGAFWRLSRMEAELRARNNAAGGGSRWAVWVNGVQVGELTDSSYAWIQHGALFDPRVHVAQAANSLCSIMRAVDWLLRVTPLLFFWLVVGMVFAAPDLFQEVLANLQVLSPREVAAGVSANAPAVAGLAVLLVVFQIMFGGSKFGHVDRFDERIWGDVRRVMDCPAEGEVSLRQVSGDTSTAQASCDSASPSGDRR